MQRPCCSRLHSHSTPTHCVEDSYMMTRKTLNVLLSQNQVYCFSRLKLVSNASRIWCPGRSPFRVDCVFAAFAIIVLQNLYKMTWFKNLFWRRTRWCLLGGCVRSTALVLKYVHEEVAFPRHRVADICSYAPWISSRCYGLAGFLLVQSEAIWYACMHCTW